MSTSDGDEDDYTSDKFLAAAAAAGTSATTSSDSYAERRRLALKQAEEKQRANRTKSLKEREEEARRKGLSTSLFGALDDDDQQQQQDGDETDTTPGAPLGGKAMSMMLKMGWKPGQGLGREAASSPTTLDQDMGFNKRKRSEDGNEEPSPRPALRRDPLPASTEPIKITMRSGKAGVGVRARSPTPPPTASTSKSTGELAPERLAALEAEADDFRARQMQVNDRRRTEARQWAARRLLMDLDEKAGVRFHPLYVIPQDLARTLPAPLRHLVPEEHAAQIIGELPRDAASLKRQMDAERLDENGDELARGDDDGSVDGDPPPPTKRHSGEEDHVEAAAAEGDEQQRTFNDGPDPIDWRSHESGVKRVLSLDPTSHLSFLVDELRQKHLYCFWCQSAYASFEEMEGPGGCPGEEEDDH